ncbi:hypothetical protein GTY51_14395 [Streptomyces sp. SID4936]|nr:hypothetical protein [Streptomyces sp. SID4936]
MVAIVRCVPAFSSGDSGGAVAAVRGPRLRLRTTTGPRATRVSAPKGHRFRQLPEATGAPLPAASGRPPRMITTSVRTHTRSGQSCCQDGRADHRSASYPARTLAPGEVTRSQDSPQQPLATTS